MTAAALHPAARDARILELLRGGASVDRASEIGAYRRAWTRGDVHRVAAEHCPPPPAGAPPPPTVPTVPLHRRRRAPVVWTPPAPPDQPRTVSLTRRQADVLDALVDGCTNAAAAGRLHITEDTTKCHVKQLVHLFGAHGRAHVVALACTGRVRVEVRQHPSRKKANP